jgi:hypothetical protein
VNDDIYSMVGGEYVLSPFAARKLRESLMLALHLTKACLDDQVETPLHPSAKGYLTY